MMAVYKLLDTSHRLALSKQLCMRVKPSASRKTWWDGVETEFQERISRTYLSRGRRLALRLDNGEVVSILLARHYRTPETHHGALGTASREV